MSIHSGFTLPTGGIIKSGATNTNTFILAANDTNFITFTTGATDTCTIAGATITGALTQTASDGGALGSATLMWSDLFLASGGVINFNNGDVTLTHSSNTLTLGGGDLALGANNLTMTGSIGVTGSRVTKGWFTDLEVTNAIAGSVTGSAATVTGAAQAAITSLGTLTTLTVDDVTINGNALSSAGASSLTITPTAGQKLVLDGHWGFDGTALTAETDANTTLTAYVGKNITIESVTFDGGVVAGVSSINGLIITNTLGTLTIPNHADAKLITSGTAATSVTLPTTGTLATLAGAETLSNKTLTLPEINDTSADHQYVFAVSELTADRTVTLPLLTGNDEFVFKDHSATLSNKIVKLTAAPATDHTVSGTTIYLKANENQAFGDVCYINADGEAQLIDADAIATMSAVVMCADATIDADASGNYLLMGIARDDTWAWTVGGLIYGTVTGTTGNTLSQTAPSGANDVVQIMGVATHADRMLFKPSLVQVELT